MISIDALKGALTQGLPGAHVEVSDLTGTQDHFQATVVAEQFAGKSRIEQHKMVYAALGDRMKKDIHALALTTMTPEAWLASKGQR
jgi:stress-induced morphogen